MISIVIPCYFLNNQLFVLTKQLLDQLIKNSLASEIIIVDDASPHQQYKGFLAKMFPTVKVLENTTNLGFAKTVNKGIEASNNNKILLLNNDLIIKSSDWLNVLNTGLIKHDMVAPAGGRMDSKWNYIPGEAKKSTDKFSYLVGWCLLVKKEVFDKIGLMPTNFSKGFFEDVLFSYRAKKAGFKLGIVENVGIEHLYHQTFKAENIDLAKELAEKRKIFLDIISKEK